ncbi:hypothetical protein MesoLjLb_43480 [Mesorhizobium sp. L-8-3]|nr:hypothetical protein MesoLjLb_43480 [Mesorhizobium sp. L-8-3]
MKSKTSFATRAVLISAVVLNFALTGAVAGSPAECDHYARLYTSHCAPRGGVLGGALSGAFGGGIFGGRWGWGRDPAVGAIFDGIAGGARHANSYDAAYSDAYHACLAGRRG